MFAILILLIGAIVRLYCYSPELWLDEIWSIMHLDMRDSIWSIFTMHHDNNHYLYSIYYWFILNSRSILLAKLPAIITGLALPCIMTWYYWGKSKKEGLLIAIVSSFALIPVSITELGRGYSPMLFFGFLAYIVFEKHRHHPHIKTALLYGCLMSISLLWHLTVLHLYVALGIVSTYLLLTSSTKKEVFLQAIYVHILPTITLAFLYYIDIRHMQIGGGIGLNETEAPIVLLSSVFGYLELEQTSVLIAYGLLIGSAIYSEYLIRKDPIQFVFLVSILLIAPCAWMIICTPPIIYIRYFVICQLFAVVFLARALSLCNAYIASTITILFVAGNLYGIFDYLNYRYGTYMSTFAYIQEHSAHDIPIVGGNSDFIIPMLMYQYERKNHLSGSFVYIGIEDIAESKPQWILSHKLQYIQTAPKHFSIDVLNNYSLVENAQTHDGLWYIYKRINNDFGTATQQELLSYTTERNRIFNELAWFPYNADTNEQAQVSADE